MSLNIDSFQSSEQVGVQNLPHQATLSNISSSILPTAKSTHLGVAKKWSPCVLDGEQTEDMIAEETTPFGATLPGHGESGDNCGQMTLCTCNICGHHWETESKCNQRSCPNCWTSWLVKESEKASSRLWVLTNKLYCGKRNRRILHVTVSLPYVKGQSFFQMRKKAMSIAMKRGLSGGLIICHTHRANNHEYIPDGYIHYHIVGVALGNVSVPQKGEQLPYIFKVIKDKRFNDYRGVRVFEDLKRLVGYQLSHCAIVKGHHSLAWFGFLSYNYSICGVSFNTKSRFTEDYPEVAEHLSRIYRIQCPKCGSINVSITPSWMVEHLFSYDFHPEVTEWLKANPPNG